MLQSLIIAGFVQGILLTFFLLKTSRGKPGANKILAAYVFILCCYLLIPSLIRNDYSELPHLVGISFPLLFLIGPAIYFYANSITRNAETPGRLFYLHFLPALAVCIYFIPLFLKNGTFKIHLIESLHTKGMHFDFAFLWNAACIHILLYHAWLYLKIRRSNKEVENYYSSIENLKFTWLSRIALWTLLLWSAYFIGYLLILFKVEIDPLHLIDEVFAVILSFFIYYLSFVALEHPNVFPGSAIRSPSGSKTNRINMPVEKRQIHIAKLAHLIDTRKVYLNPSLTLEELAKMLDLSPRILSQIIRDEYHKNFFEYINYQRVQEVKKKLLDTANNRLTIVALAIDSGFNSKSAFNEVFKKFEHTTPSKFKKKWQSL